MFSVEALDFINSTFYARTRKLIKESRDNERRFVHYTSAAAALDIIRSEEFWLRNSGLMNDYSEISHGEACIEEVFLGDNDASVKTKGFLDGLHPGLHAQVASDFISLSTWRRQHTYLLSISEHGPAERPASGWLDHPEARLGRLSMWRAYTRGAGVALVLNPTSLLSETQAYPAYVAPVFYGTPSDFSSEWLEILSNLEVNKACFRDATLDELVRMFRHFTHFAALACKHPGFAEEREWRITHNFWPGDFTIGETNLANRHRLRTHFPTIAGIPQRVVSIPFVNYPDEGLTGADLGSLIESIVIGPSEAPHVIADAIISVFEEKHIYDAAKRIVISDIPLRQS